MEIAIRAPSPAVNDTFTALTCIDWLTDGLCRVSRRQLPSGVHRDGVGAIRVIEPGPSYCRIVDRASDKIRQASRGMPAVAIRQLDELTKVLGFTTTRRQRAALRAQADRIVLVGEQDVPDAADRREIRRRHEAFAARHENLARPVPAGAPPTGALSA